MPDEKNPSWKRSRFWLWFVYLHSRPFPVMAIQPQSTYEIRWSKPYAYPNKQPSYIVS